MNWLMLNNKTLLTAVLFGCVFFFLAGGFSVLDGLAYGFGSVNEAQFGLSAVFFAGFLFTGLFGLGYAIKKRSNPTHSLLGLVVVFFSYYAIDSMFQVVIR